MRLFARRQDSRPSAGRPGQSARRRARPEAEPLDARLLMAADHPVRPDAIAAADLSERVAQVLKPYLDQDQFPGISVAIVENGQVALAHGYGLSNARAGTPVEADTRFDIGSVTKTFTALGILLLYQQSQGTSHPLDLNAPIRDYLHNTPSFKLPRKWGSVTTLELLNMTSGIPEVSGPKPWQTQIASIANDRLLFAPGTETSYSDTNYDLLGELIEQWTGEKYGTFIEDQILQPLGMSETEELGRSAKVPDQAVGYDAFRRGKWHKASVQNGPAMYAAAGMVSTAQDMATYMTALLSGRLLDPATYALMYASTPTLEYGTKPASYAERGLGWDAAIHSSSATVEVTKSGDVPGFTSQLILYPASDSGVFISIDTNSQSSRDPSAATAMQVAESVYEAAEAASPDDAHARKAADRTSNTVAPWQRSGLYRPAP